MTELVTFRKHTEDDLPFLHDSWGTSYFSGIAAYKHISPEEFHKFHRPIRDRFFARPQASVLIAADPEDPWFILGWIATEQLPSGLIVQYLYVKSALKKEGIAKQLLSRAVKPGPVFFTHLTDKADRIMNSHSRDFADWVEITHLV